MSNHTKYELNSKNYDITYFKKPKDIAVIQLKNSDEFIQDIQFLDYDRNYAMDIKSMKMQKYSLYNILVEKVQLAQVVLL